jgi:hypothetical protein
MKLKLIQTKAETAQAQVRNSPASPHKINTIDKRVLVVELCVQSNNKQIPAFLFGVPAILHSTSAFGLTGLAVIAESAPRIIPGYGKTRTGPEKSGTRIVNNLSKRLSNPRGTGGPGETPCTESEY